MLTPLPLLLTLCCSATELPPQTPVVSAQSRCAEQYRADLALLTSEEANGRATGTAGVRIAIEHLEHRFKALGLLPGFARADAAGDAESAPFRQEFSAPDRSPRSYAADQTWLRVDGNPVAAMGVDAAPFRGSTSGEVSARVVFVGHGVRWDGVHDDYAGLDVRGKIVLVLRGLPRLGRDGTARAVRERVSREQRFRAASFSGKLATARERGAIGFLLCDPRLADNRPAEVRAALNAPLTVSEGALPALWITTSTARALLAVDGHPDSIESKGRFDRLVDGARSALSRTEPPDHGTVNGVRVSLQTKMGPPSGLLPATNLIGRIGGAVEGAGCVVVGAHYDHIGTGQFATLGGPEAIGKLHPGADDNASGVAGLLELARLLRGRERARRTVYVVAFGAEEQGRFGSKRFLDELRRRGERPVVMLNLNMIGRGAAGLRVEGVGSSKPLAKIVRRFADDCSLSVAIRKTASGRSDHQTFLRQKVPALLFHTGLHKQYHRPTDVAALVQVDSALRIAALAAEVAHALADREDPLDFVPMGRDKR